MTTFPSANRIGTGRTGEGSTVSSSPKAKDLLLARKFVGRMKGSKRKNSQIFEKQEIFGLNLREVFSWLKSGVGSPEAENHPRPLDGPQFGHSLLFHPIDGHR